MKSLAKFHAVPIEIKNASIHNVRGVDLTLPTQRLIVFTGVSGSGKSSLAFDTICLEAKQRYLECLSPAVRSLLGDLSHSTKDRISGLSPAIAIEQKTNSKNPRSTVGTMTGILDFLRVLFARLGTPHCPISGQKLQGQSLEALLQTVAALPHGDTFFVLSPLASQKKGSFQEEFRDLLSQGFLRIRLQGQIVELSPDLTLDEKQAHDIDLVIDRVILTQENLPRMFESVEKALEMGKGFCSLLHKDTGEETSLSTKSHSTESGQSYPPLEPHDFSFNHPKGMCPTCQGLGVFTSFDLEKILDQDKSLEEDCCSIASSYQTIRYGNIYRNLAKMFGFKISTPWRKIPEEGQKAFLYGLEKKWTPMLFTHPEKKTRWEEYVQWKGVLQEARDRLQSSTSGKGLQKHGALLRQGICPSCQGSRIASYPSATRLFGKTLLEIVSLSLEEALEFFQKQKLSSTQEIVGKELLQEILTRLSILCELGLTYLSLQRPSPSLSGGEAQRVRLSGQIGSGLTGAIYALDEPSIGLHPTDHHKLLHSLLRLRDQGNTVIVVEHDEETIRAADFVVDMGPGAGSLGGEVVVAGTLDDLLASPTSLTGAYLSQKRRVGKERPPREKASHFLTLKGASHNNLRHIDVRIPLQRFCCVTGVSGSGKSSLVQDTLYPLLANHLHHAQLDVGKHDKVEGVEFLEKVIDIDQTPIGRTPRSNPATYTKLFDDIRDLFASLPESLLRGCTVGHFSFNVKEGSCPCCEGMGQVQVDMDFLEDVWKECPQCKGKRFTADVLQVHYQGKSIHDVLSMDVRSALVLFQDIPKIAKKLRFLEKVGLSYLPLGQSSTTLSGGEAQRIKLAKELLRPSKGNTLYILDEPTTGLHFEDIHHLVEVLHELVDRGNTVLVVEHNLDLLRSADWILDLGPGPGKQGGNLVAEGTPQDIERGTTLTGQALRGIHVALSPPHPTASSSHITLQNASQHNLQHLSLSLEKNQIIACMGPSGAGKSSFALDTLYAEAGHRFAETLSPYLRGLLGLMPKPQVDRIEGLPPAIALEQKTGGLNPRSTIATMTELYDKLRILYAHLGTPFDPETHEPLEATSPEKICEKALSFEGEKLHILIPLEKKKKETLPELQQKWLQRGFLRIRVDGVYFDLDEEIPHIEHVEQKLFLSIDRLLVEASQKPRLLESIHKGLHLSDGILLLALPSQDIYCNLALSAPSTGISYPPIHPQTFSFNHIEGMCLECQGLGTTYGAHLLSKPLLARQSPFALLDHFCDLQSQEIRLLENGLPYLDIPLDTPLKSLSSSEQQAALQGDPTWMEVSSKARIRWRGIETTLSFLAKFGKKELQESLKEELQTLPCPHCEGERLNPLGRNVQIGPYTLPKLCTLTIFEANEFLSSLQVPPFLEEILSQIHLILGSLLQLGLHYLSLSRSAPTLSGGELQRVRLAKQLQLGLTSCLYILEEPSMGLHPANNEMLHVQLKRLANSGNTVLLIDHDPLTLLQADYFLDFGPKGGTQGGHIVAKGTFSQIEHHKEAPTIPYLTKKKTILDYRHRPLSFPIHIEDAHLHNLQHLSLSLPIHAIVAFCGVSGSGKSTLVRHLLYGAVQQALAKRRKKDAVFHQGTHFRGLSCFDRVVFLDQTPIGQTSRADVSTYTDIQPLLRAHFAKLPLAKMKGLNASHFSPNHLRGMCRTCWGMGSRTVSLQFLPPVKILCEGCHGERLNPLSLQVLYKGKNFGQILQLSLEEALPFFDDIPKIYKKLHALHDIGLSYLSLGREIATLSHGEMQRLRLSQELLQKEGLHTLYILDEPTRNLHYSDIEKLLQIFHTLADKKNTLYLIDHTTDLLSSADYIVDLGPGAGREGGTLVATGRPDEIAKNPHSQTGRYL